MERNEFREKAKSLVDDVFNRIESIEQKSVALKAEAKDVYEKELEELKVRRDEMLKRYEELNDSAESQWGEVKDAFSESADYFKEGFNRIFSLFK